MGVDGSEAATVRPPPSTDTCGRSERVPLRVRGSSFHLRAGAAGSSDRMENGSLPRLGSVRARTFVLFLVFVFPLVPVAVHVPELDLLLGQPRPMRSFGLFLDGQEHVPATRTNLASFCIDFPVQVELDRVFDASASIGPLKLQVAIPTFVVSDLHFRLRTVRHVDGQQDLVRPLRPVHVRQVCHGVCVCVCVFRCASVSRCVQDRHVDRGTLKSAPLFRLWFLTRVDRSRDTSTVGSIGSDPVWTGVQKEPTPSFLLSLVGIGSTPDHPSPWTGIVPLWEPDGDPVPVSFLHLSLHVVPFRVRPDR